MIKISFVTLDGQTVETEATAGEHLMDVAVNAAIDGIPGDCGGCCSCATCHIKVPAEWADKVGSAEEEEAEMLECVTDADETSRLACQVTVDESMNGMTVMVGSAD